MGGGSSKSPGELDGGGQLYVSLKIENPSIRDDLIPHVFGSIPIIGSWDSTRSLSMERESAFSWELSFVVPPNHGTLVFKFLLKSKEMESLCVVEEGGDRLLTGGKLEGGVRAAVFRFPGCGDDELLEYRVFVIADIVSPFDLAASWRAYKENLRPSTVRGVPDICINAAPEGGQENVSAASLELDLERYVVPSPTCSSADVYAADFTATPRSLGHNSIFTKCDVSGGSPRSSEVEFHTANHVASDKVMPAAAGAVAAAAVADQMHGPKEDQCLAIVLVGLPARGKTFTAVKLTRYLRWLGHETKHFNVGKYRRLKHGVNQAADFFRGDNSEGVEARNEVAALAMDDMLSWMQEGGQVGIFDATNSTKQRRNMIMKMAEGKCKVLGVEKSASQRDIQKAFHKLSLKYHPDKNKNKGAQEKFAEINNAYEILSDEDKRKNYDLYGDAQGNTGFDEANFGNREGYTYFTGGGPGGEHFTSGPGGWQTTSGQGNSRSFSFSFGGDSRSSGNRFGFDMGDIFSNLFQTSGKGSRDHHGGFSGSGARSNSEFSPSGNIQDIDLQYFNKKIRDQGMTWLLLFYTSPTKGYNALESLMSDVAKSLNGAVKAGKINCQTDQTLCRDLGVSSTRSARLFVYGYGSNGKDYLLEYTGEFDSRSLKSFSQDHLPRISKRVDLSSFEFPRTNENLPQVLLLSTKIDTPVMWRVISGLYRKRFAFYDTEVHDALHPFLKKFEVKALPALVGRLSNGDAYVLKAGISVKDLQSGINELKSLLESFERKNNLVSSQSKKTESQGKNIPLLTGSNLETLCGDNTPVCFIGVFRTQKAREKLDNILSALSQKTLVRKQNQGSGHGDSISYSLLDAKKQSQILSSFDRSGFKSLDMFILSYKPRKGKFAAYAGELTMEEVEKFVSSVLNGDVIFTKIHQNPTFR